MGRLVYRTTVRFRERGFYSWTTRPDLPVEVEWDPDAFQQSGGGWILTQACFPGAFVNIGTYREVPEPTGC